MKHVVRTGCEGEKERCGWGLGKEWGVGGQRREGHENGGRGEAQKRVEWWRVSEEGFQEGARANHGRKIARVYRLENAT